MDAMELDMRMRLAELQLKYREKQRELARLQRRSSSELVPTYSHIQIISTCGIQPETSPNQPYP